MFLHLCVILFTGGGWLSSMHHRGSASRGLSPWGGGVEQSPLSTMGYDQQVGGTHPTGMHSCLVMVMSGIERQ